ncbi:MAG: hypothetical protein ACODAA_06645 [Gemmatimonadota bacterium]
MGILDGVARSVTKQLIGQFGKPAVLVTPGQDYDPSTLRTSGTPSRRSISVLVGDTTRLRELGFHETGEVEHGDLVFEVAASELGSDPSTKQQVVLDERIYAVVQVKPLYSGEEVAKWALHVRR